MWMVYAIAAAAFWGLEYILMGRLFNGRISPLFLLTIQMAIGTALFGSISLATGAMRRDSNEIATNPEAFRLVLMSAVVFALGSYMIARSIKESNALVAGLMEVSYPLFIFAFMAILGWNEPVNHRTVLGGILIVSGAAILQSSL